MTYYRIKRDDLHEKAMLHLANNGGHEPADEFDRDNNILISDEEAEEMITEYNRRKLSDWRAGWPVTLWLDRWTAFTYYGYDAGDILA